VHTQHLVAAGAINSETRNIIMMMIMAKEKFPLR
jgi:hypothetical protein